MRRILQALALVALVGPSAGAQSLADRVSAVRDGEVTFHFTPRPGVCGDGRTYMRIGHSYHGSFSSDFNRRECEMGPLQVQLSMRDGEVERVQSWVGRLRQRDARDLGAVPAGDAARYLISIASRGRSGASAKAILPAVLADSATVWPALLTIAKDETRGRQTRQDASFWLSRYAAGAIAGHANQPLDDEDDHDDGDADLKSHAVFVLSQLPHGQGVPNLLEVARSKGDVRVRSKALFWLGQSGDRRAIELFETLLR